MYLGGDSLDQIISNVCKELDYFWLFGLKHNGGNPRYWAKKLMVGFKPILVLTNGKPEETHWMDTLFTGDSKDKKHHKWGQSVNYPVQIIEILTNEGDIILDPFLGGGTTLKATRMTDRVGLGFEIDEKHEHSIRECSLQDIKPLEGYF